MATLRPATVKTFQNGGLTEGEAKVQTLRLQDLSQKEIADHLDIELGTVKSYCNRIDTEKSFRLPGVSKIGTHAKVTADHDTAVVIWFENGAKLRYRADTSDKRVYEEVFKADDPYSVYETIGVAVDTDRLHEVALESLAEYINGYREMPERLRNKCPHLFEALTLLPA